MPNEIAVALGKLRWDKVSPEDHKKIASKGGSASWNNLTEDQRKARIDKLAAARKSRTKPLTS